MADTEKGGSGKTAAYPSFVSFKNFVGDLSENCLPDRIDRTVMVGRSNAVKSALKGALDFLGLVNPQGVPTTAFRSLKDAHGDEDGWKAALGSVIVAAYAPVIGDLSLTNGTAGQLATRFRENGNVSGATLTSAVRFYLAALDDAGIERSSRLKAPPRPKRKKKGKGGEEDGGEDNGGGDEGFTDVPIPEDWVSQPMYLPGRDHPVTIAMPTDIKEWEWSLVNAYILGYIKKEEANKPSPSTDAENEG